MVYDKLNESLKDYASLKNGDKVIFYDKHAYGKVSDVLNDLRWDGHILDVNWDIRVWNDGVHASCFFCWIEEDGTLDYWSFDCYV